MRYIVLSLVFFGTFVQAATVIDFQDPAIPGLGDGPFDTQGYTFSFERGSLPEGQPSYLKFPDALATCPTCTMTMSQVGGGLFSLNSLVASETSDSYLGEYTLHVAALLAGGSTVTQSFFVDEPQLSFDVSLQGLQSVTFSQTVSYPSASGTDSGLFNSITVDAVPVPAAVWLFGSALIGLGWMKRRPSP